MQIRRHTSALIALVAAAFSISVALAPPAQAQQEQERKHSGFRTFMGALASAALNANTGTLVGQWRGAKTENDPIHGGYLNLSFAFAFGADGSYQEAAYMGSRQIMFASGAYQVLGSTVAFTPQQCNFASPELEQVVRFFPIPLDSPAQEQISFSPLQGGGQLSLKDAASGEDWGLKHTF